MGSLDGCVAAPAPQWRLGVPWPVRTAGVGAVVGRGAAFRYAHNPVFTAMMLTAAGLTLMVPNLMSITGLVASVVAIQLQVRVVEEPYLQGLHGPTYSTYAATVGRFLARIGRLRPSAPAHVTPAGSASG